MRLMRVGPPGAEIPIAHTMDNNQYDLRGVTGGIDGAFLDPRHDGLHHVSACTISNGVFERELQLEPGDVINTGTPEGVAVSGRYPYLRDGNVIELEIDEPGHQHQRVRSA